MSEPTKHTDGTLALPPEEIPRPPTPTPSDWDPVAYAEQRAVQVELPVGSLALWGVPNVLSALIAHDSGNFNLSSLLWEAVQQDPRIMSALDKRTRAVAGSEIIFEPANETRRARKIAEEASESWDQWVTETEAQALHRWLIGMGFGLAQILRDYENDWAPSVNVWHPQNLYWYWSLDRNFGKWQLITSTQPSVIEPIGGDGQWIFPRTTAKYPWMLGVIRSIALRYMARWDVFKSWARQCEKEGLAFLKLFVPISADPKDITKLERQVRFLGSEPQLTLRKGSKEEGNQWDAVFEKVAGNSHLTFKDFFNEAAAEISIAILGETLTTEVKEGSRAAAQVHDGVRQDLKVADAKLLATMWRSQLLRPWTIDKYGDASLTPRMFYAVAPPTDLQARAKTLVDLSAAIKGFRDNGVPVDTNALAAEFKVPLLKTDAGALPNTDE